MNAETVRRFHDQNKLRCFYCGRNYSYESLHISLCFVKGKGEFPITVCSRCVHLESNFEPDSVRLSAQSHLDEQTWKTEYYHDVLVNLAKRGIH